MRADAMLENGDLDGYFVWKKILQAVEILRRNRPAASGVRAPTMATGASSCSGGCRGPSEGGAAHPGANVPRESASLDTTTPATFATVALRHEEPLSE
jgi:hypothetical protein